jgi:peptide-methionine (R)-S-oxide reductase
MTKQTTRTDAEWKALLAEKGAEPLAFEVTRHAATERPFTGKYEDHWTPGQYACICCGAELFKSDTKFDAGCGWPSFWQAARASTPPPPC